jgi:aquaporin related protein
MAAESSELPTHYGGKSADGEVVTRANQDLSVAPLPLRSPSRAYDRSRRLSPQVATIDFEFVPGDRDDRPRRRQSTQPRRYSNTAESDRPYFSESRDSQGQLRARDDGYYRYREDDRDYRQEPRRDIGGHERERERERDDYRHPDSYDSRRPPRAFRNFDQETYDYSRSSKPTFKYTDRDVEPRTLLTPQRRGRFPDEEESIDGYNYEGHKTRATLDFANLTKEQKAAMMRLPWTQWMNSSFKNRTYALFAVMRNTC